MISRDLQKALLWTMYHTGRDCVDILKEWAKEPNIDDRERLRQERDKVLKRAKNEIST